MVQLLKAKVHRARVTSTSQHYEGSLTLDVEYMEKAGFLPHEKILVGNIYNGNRFETYVIPGERGSRTVQLNGATAHLGDTGDALTIMTFAFYTPEEAAEHHPKVLVLDENNQIVRQEG